MAQTLKPRPRSAVERFTPLKPVQDDAWSNLFKPPPNETAEEKRERLMFQQEAQRISREIDESILESKKLLEKKKKAVKVLLLGTLITTTRLTVALTSPSQRSGQAESGKSTMLRSE